MDFLNRNLDIEGLDVEFYYDLKQRLSSNQQKKAESLLRKRSPPSSPPAETVSGAPTPALGEGEPGFRFLGDKKGSLPSLKHSRSGLTVGDLNQRHHGLSTTNPPVKYGSKVPAALPGTTPKQSFSWMTHGDSYKLYSSDNMFLVSQPPLKPLDSQRRPTQINLQSSNTTLAGVRITTGSGRNSLAKLKGDYSPALSAARSYTNLNSTAASGGFFQKPLYAAMSTGRSTNEMFLTTGGTVPGYSDPNTNVGLVVKEPYLLSSQADFYKKTLYPKLVNPVPGAGQKPIDQQLTQVGRQRRLPIKTDQQHERSLGLPAPSHIGPWEEEEVSREQIQHFLRLHHGDSFLQQDNKLARLMEIKDFEKLTKLKYKPLFKIIQSQKESHKSLEGFTFDSSQVNQ